MPRSKFRIRSVIGRSSLTIRSAKHGIRASHFGLAILTPRSDTTETVAQAPANVNHWGSWKIFHRLNQPNHFCDRITEPKHVDKDFVVQTKSSEVSLDRQPRRQIRTLLCFQSNSEEDRI